MKDVIVVDGPDHEAPRAVVEPAGRFSHLPEPVHLADTITSAETAAQSGPELPVDPQQDFMLRYAFL